MQGFGLAGASKRDPAPLCPLLPWWLSSFQIIFGSFAQIAIMRRMLISMLMEDDDDDDDDDGFGLAGE